jgi:soluble lytic murein transglycosylase
MSDRRPGKGLWARALGGLVCIALWQCAAADAYESRQLYQRALGDLRHDRIEQFEAAKARLAGYALYPYLEYHDLHRRLRQVSPADIQAFRERYADSPIAARLNEVWLIELARRGAWGQYVKFYEPGPNVELQCLYLRALDHRGATDSAMAPVAALWLIGGSQPKACDPLFATWIGRGHLNYGLVWERLTLALQARQWQLARYLIGLLNPDLKRHAELFFQVYRDPELIAQTRRFTTDDMPTRAIVVQGLRRLATEDPTAAAAAWATYRDKLTFSTDEARIVAQDLAIGMARRGVIDPAADLTPSPDGRHLLVFEAQTLAAIGNDAWPTVADLIQRMDESERVKPRWQYWLGRALRQTDVTTGTTTAADVQPWSALATQRHYYGFLAAQGLGIEPTLQDASAPPSPESLAGVRQSPAMLRIGELYAVDDLPNARREWNFLFPALDAAQRGAAAYLLAEIGWVDQSILAANAADLRDDLALRFPNPFLQLFRSESHATSVPLSYLYGIARQESAFAPVVRSSAGALGLMQLMPATAALTARASGERVPTPAELFHPDVNIHIGSRHLADLLQRFDGNRILVAAAYNAGPHRVDRWLRVRPPRPADVWIETIPFPETRNYVMNVLAFSYVYGQRLDRPTPFLAPGEQ